MVLYKGVNYFSRRCEHYNNFLRPPRFKIFGSDDLHFVSLCSDKKEYRQRLIRQKRFDELFIRFKLSEYKIEIYGN
jgi:hypothetical protein